MDMLVPQSIRPLPEAAVDALSRISDALGCSMDVFFEPAPKASVADTAKLLQMWSAVTSPDGRQVVFRCVREVLRAQANEVRNGSQERPSSRQSKIVT